MTAALEGVGGQQHAPGKTRYSLSRSLGGPQGQSGRAENLVPTGIRSRTAQYVVAIPTELPSPQFYINIYVLGSLNKVLVLHK